MCYDCSEDKADEAGGKAKDAGKDAKVILDVFCVLDVRVCRGGCIAHRLVQAETWSYQCHAAGQRQGRRQGRPARCGGRGRQREEEPLSACTCESERGWAVSRVGTSFERLWYLV